MSRRRKRGDSYITRRMCRRMNSDRCRVRWVLPASTTPQQDEDLGYYSKHVRDIQIEIATGFQLDMLAGLGMRPEGMTDVEFREYARLLNREPWHITQPQNLPR